MKLAIRLTMDGLQRSLSALARAMADEREWGYFDAGEQAGSNGPETQRRTTRTERHELGGD